ncbi:AsmA family protein [Candidatus Proelusimicrobium excrementi]|uniref:DUF748 domain-containing protein n=1 Tax=Candidatus Proelusimicrobium excrementi TaxID=3416222 RepID=UPI003CABEAC0|nr:AsmA family protein [Elusimicrobiaceae bacterium]
MRFVRLILRFLLYAAGAAALILLAADLSLRWLLPTDSVQEKISSLIASKTNGEVQIKRVTAGLTGINAEGLSLILPEGGDIASIESLSLKVMPLKLIRGEIDFNRIFIDGVKVNIIRDKNGKFNFDGLFADAAGNTSDGEENSESSSFIKDLRVKRFQIRNAEVSYLDESAGISASLNNLFLDVYDFSFTAPFRVSVNAEVSYNGGGVKAESLPFGFTLYPDLNLLKLEEASSDIRLLVVEHGPATLQASGAVKNFINPQVRLKMKGTGVSDKILSAFADTPEFTIGDIDINLDASYNTEAGKLLVNIFNVKALNSSVDAGGIVRFGKELSYDVDVKAALSFAEIAKTFSILSEYRLSGTVDAAFKAVNNDVSGSLSVKQAGFYYSQAGAFSGVNLTLAVKSLKEISLSSLTGRLNGYPFRAALSYTEKASSGDVNFNLQADKMLIKLKKQPKPAYDPDKDPVIAGAPEISPEVKKVWFLPPLHIKGAVKIGSLEAPFINAEAVDFKADIRNFKPDIANIDGGLSLVTSAGVIKDLYHLTNANAVTKVLFVSLGVVSKLINSLDVLSLLNSLSAAVLPSDKQKEALEASPDKIEGALEYDSFKINLTFANGLTDIKNGNFISSLLSFNLAGQINFNNRKINMTVDAAPGKHESGGIMPLRLNVSGTVDEPQGNMSMLSSAANLVSQTIFNNAGSRFVKKSVGGILGIFGIGSQSKKAKKAKADAQAEADAFVPIELPEKLGEE